MTATFPRVTIPGVDPEASAAVRAMVDAANAHDEGIHRNRQGMVAAMLRTGYRPYLGHVYRRPRPTAHVRLKARLAARSSKRKGAGDAS